MLKTIIIFKIALKIMNNCNFTSVSISNGFNLYLSQGDSESVNITIDKDLEKYLVVKVERGELKIYLKRRFSLSFSNRRKEMKAVVVVKDINRLSVSGGGRINTEMIKSDELGVKISGGGIVNLLTETNELNCSTSGGGIINLEGKTTNLDLRVSGGGKIKSDIIVKDAKLTMSGGGIATIKSTNANSLKTRLSGGGHATLYGSVTDLSIKTSGGGIISAKNLNAENCKLSMSGGGAASINVTENLDLSASGGVIVKCYSEPSNINKRVSGGSILRIIR